MIIYKKTKETFNRNGIRETVAKNITVFFLGIPIYRYRYESIVRD